MPVGTMWTPEEDERLAQLVNIHGPKKWSQIASDLGTKGSKQCRRRWKNYISLKERKQGSWTPEEDALLLEGHRCHGNKWTLIAQEIGGRTDNAVKNRWAALQKKRRGDDGPSAAAAAAAAAGGGEPGYARYLPCVMRPQNDLLGVRRVIAKDQPRYRATQQQHMQQLQQLQMQQLGGMPAGEGPWAMEEARQSDQLPYAMPAVTTGMVAPLAEAPMSSSMLIRKPDLMINIPGGSAAAEPQLPYSQRPQPNMDFRGPQEVQQQLGHGMELPPVPMRVDDSLLSTSRQAEPGSLASPSEPGAINSLCRYLCSATPHDMQQQLAGGRQTPPPWATRGLEQQQQPQQLLPPPPMPQQTLLHPEQQQMQMQYHQVPVTGQMMVPQHQQEQQHLPMIPVQPSHAMLHQPEQHQHLLHMSQYAQSAQQQQQPGRQVVRTGSGGQDFCQPQMQLAHASPSIPSSAGSSSSRHQQQQQYQQHHNGFAGSHQVPQSHIPAGAVMQQHGGMLPPHVAHGMSSQQQQQVKYAPAGWHMQQQQPAQGYGSPSLVPVGVAPGSSGYMPPAISSGMPVMTYHHQQQHHHHHQTPPLQQLQQPQQQQQQQQQPRGEEPPRWGPEELRQLLDILGDPQRQQQQQQQQSSLLQRNQHLQQGLGSGTGSLPGSAGMSPHVPEEEVEQVNNGHGHAGHALCNVMAEPDSRPCQPVMRVNDTSCQPGVLE